MTDYTTNEKPALEKIVEEARKPNSKDTADKAENKKPFTEAELERFWISIMNQEPYEERSSKKGCAYTLRALTDGQKYDIETYLDKQDIKLRANYEAVEARCHIAYTLVQFNKLTMLEKDTLLERLEKLHKVPMAVIDVLLDLVVTFNKKVAEMTKEVTSSNF